MTEQTAAVEVWARMLCAADVHVNDGDHPTWQQLAAMPGRGQDEYRKAARWLLSRLSVGQTAAPSAPADRGAPGMYYCDDCDHAFTAPTDTESCICSCGARAWQEKPADADLHTRIRGVIRDCPALYPDDIADRVLAALSSAYRSLLARLEADRAGHLRAAGQATEEVLRIDGAASASTLRHAAAMAVHAFEGPDAAQAYMQRTEGGEGVPADDDLRERLREVADRLAAHAKGFQDVLDESDRGPWGRTVGADIDELRALLAALPEPRLEFDVQVGLQRLADAVQRGETAADSPAPGEIYRHYKGDLYTVLAVAEDTGTGAPVVVYRDEHRRVWSRPLVEFAGTVADGVQRFTLEGELAALPSPADRAAVALAEVRRLCEMTIEGSVRVDAIHQARDTLAVIDRRMADEAGQAGEGR